MRQGKRHITHYTDSTHQLVSAANAQTYALSFTYGDWGKIQQYDLQQTDLTNNVTTSQTRYYSYGSLNEGQTTFAPNNISYADGTNVNEQYGIGGSLQRRETNIPGNQPNEELYRFGADGNLRMYSYDRLFYSLYGYDGGTTRTYKYSMDLSPNWVNGRLEAVNFNMHNAMFYPNSYLNFNNDGYYTKHYYNGMERIASRLGDNNLLLATHDPELQDRKWQLDSNIRRNIADITGYEFLPVGEEQNPEDPKPVFELPQVGLTNLIPNISSIYYYHSNHLGSTCYVTDENASVVQGFLYAPFGEITNEYNSGFGNNVLPKYSFNAKELDEETGMYYYEARYYAPPTFTSRDPLFEKYPTFSPYAYCANNPIKYIDPTGEEFSEHIDKFGNLIVHYDDKDNSVYLHADGTTKADIDKQIAQNNNTGGNGRKIGELGGNIDITEIMCNKLKQSVNEAIKMDIIDYYYAVKQNGVWDLKNNTNTIFGVAWAVEKKLKTTFSFGNNESMSAADVGNYHAGYTGRAAGIPNYLLWKGAGFAETIKEFKEGSTILAIGRAHLLLIPSFYPSGDRLEDFKWNTKGMIDYEARTIIKILKN